MDPSYLFRSPILSDAENNNLMAAAAAAEKARAMMMMGASRPPGPIGGGGPHPLFSNAALAALAASQQPPTTKSPSSSSSSLPQYNLNPALFSHWNAIHQAALASVATSNGLTLTSSGLSLPSQCSPESPKPSRSPGSSSGTPPGLSSLASASDLRLARPLFAGMPPLRFSPYVIPPKRSSPSPNNNNQRTPSPAVSEKMRVGSASPSRSASTSPLRP